MEHMLAADLFSLIVSIQLQSLKHKSAALYRKIAALKSYLNAIHTKLLDFQNVPHLRRRLQQMGKVEDGLMLKTMLELLNLIDYDSKLYDQELQAAAPVGKILTPLCTYKCFEIYSSCHSTV
jgi:hypothetical protein